jgi:hypothetical protein
MTHVFGLCIKIRRNERLWQTLDTRNMVGSNFGFKIHGDFSLKNSSTQKFAVFLIPIATFVRGENLHHLILLHNMWRKVS